MKKLSILLLSICVLPLMSLAQVEIVPQVGYMFGGTMSFYEGQLRAGDGMSYGGSVIIPEITYGTDLEINYTRMDSRVDFRSYYNTPGFDDESFDVGINYIQIGALKTFGTSDMVRPFGSFSLGTTIFSPKVDYKDAWRFSITLGAGAKIYLTDRIGIILRGRLLLPMYFGGVGFYMGTGGSGLSVNSFATFAQGDFSGGLIFSLGK